MRTHPCQTWYARALISCFVYAYEHDYDIYPDIGIALHHMVDMAADLVY